MKIAISLPDPIFQAADTLAARLGVSRSGLIALALSEFIAKHRSSKVTEQLDAVYSATASRVDPGVRRAQRRAIGKDEW
jgi:hypothetical protein